MKLIVNADDFGLTDGVTRGILDAIRNGIVTSTTMMVNAPGTLTAAKIVREDPSLAVGLHINISLGTPMTACPSLTQNGHFLKPAALGTDERYLEEEVYREIHAQYAEFLKLTGRKPTHLDSHLYTHQKFPKVRTAVKRLAEETELPVRDLAAGRYPRIRFEGNFKVSPGQTKEQLREKCLRLLRELEGYPVAELMVHPAFDDPWLRANSSYNIQRILEHEVLTDPDIQKYIARAPVTPASFRDLE